MAFSPSSLLPHLPTCQRPSAPLFNFAIGFSEHLICSILLLEGAVGKKHKRVIRALKVRWPEEMAQSVQRIPCKHKDVDLIPSTHVEVLEMMAHL